MLKQLPHIGCYFSTGWNNSTSLRSCLGLCFETHFNANVYKNVVYCTDFQTSFVHLSIFLNKYVLGTPDRPRNVEIACSVNTAKIQWRSSFNGGVTQTFKALVIFEQRLVSQSQIINDYGENVIHNTELTNLQPTTKYAFYIVAQNKCGNSSSKRRECTTLEGMSIIKPLLQYLASTLSDDVDQIQSHLLLLLSPDCDSITTFYYNNNLIRCARSRQVGRHGSSDRSVDFDLVIRACQ